MITSGGGSGTEEGVSWVRGGGGVHYDNRLGLKVERYEIAFIALMVVWSLSDRFCRMTGIGVINCSRSYSLPAINLQSFLIG